MIEVATTARERQKMMITLSGTPGSGKSTVAKNLARRLKCRRIDMGAIRRQIAGRKGMTLPEYNRLAEHDPRIDRATDAFQQRLGRTRKNALIEGRLSFHFIPHSLKIFLYASPAVGAGRIWRELRTSSKRNEGRLCSLADVERAVRQRIRSDKKRYWKYYRVNPFLKRHYDLFLDTSDLNRTQVFDRVRSFVSRKVFIV